MRFLLDEMIGRRIAEQLRLRGHDVIAITERADLRGLPDDAVLEFARDEQRILVTLNVADFARLHQHWLADGRQHCGTVIVTTRAFPLNGGFVGAVVTALLHAAEISKLPAAGELVFLQP